MVSTYDSDVINSLGSFNLPLLKDFKVKFNGFLYVFESFFLSLTLVGLERKPRTLLQVGSRITLNFNPLPVSGLNLGVKYLSKNI